MSIEKTNRNMKIMRDRADGMSWHKLGKKYKLSFARARKIWLEQTAKAAKKK